MATRKTSLEDESHRVRFVYTPKYVSWLNQSEIRFSQYPDPQDVETSYLHLS